MKVTTKVLLVVLIHSAASSAIGSTPPAKVMLYRGASDASAAAALSRDMFIVADDENNVLRVYKTDKGGPPVFSYDLTDFLGIEPEHPEADIEGATMIAGRIYWMTSHGRNKDGKIRPNRYRFFATTVKVESASVTIRPTGIPCKTLVHKLLETKSMHHLELDKATQLDAIDLNKKDRKKLAPKEQGLNIEALCASADGKTIYIGFRNPRPYDKASRRAEALVVPLKNPDTVIEKGSAAFFGEPILWHLDGLGIRSMEYSPYHKAHFIVAGSHDDKPQFALYRWSGKRNAAPILICGLNSQTRKFSPEALIPFMDSPGFLLLSDDGTMPVRVSDRSECMQDKLNDDGTCPNKFLTEANKKTFRAIWLRPQ